MSVRSTIQAPYSQTALYNVYNTYTLWGQSGYGWNVEENNRSACKIQCKIADELSLRIHTLHDLFSVNTFCVTRILKNRVISRTGSN